MSGFRSLLGGALDCMYFNNDTEEPILEFVYSSTNVVSERVYPRTLVHEGRGCLCTVVSLSREFLPFRQPAQSPQASNKQRMPSD